MKNIQADTEGSQSSFSAIQPKQKHMRNILSLKKKTKSKHAKTSSDIMRSHYKVAKAESSEIAILEDIEDQEEEKEVKLQHYNADESWRYSSIPITPDTRYTYKTNDGPNEQPADPRFFSSQVINLSEYKKENGEVFQKLDMSPI
mmetsp:Transcript_25525/g.28361  ORF Transcript_25525/g.28361 Transcript_25525/m.28361 type:complete len:145 (-) Transcript_25525:17-451(-)